MRDILLWDAILKQLDSRAYGPAPTYRTDPMDALLAVGEQLTSLGMPVSVDLDPFLDLNVSWAEFEYNMTLMAEEGLILAVFRPNEISYVQLTDEGRRVFEMRDEARRLSRPELNLVKQANFAVSQLAFPALAICVLVWMVMDTI